MHWVKKLVKNAANAVADATTCHYMPRQRRNSKSTKQQLRLRSKLIIAGLCAALVLALVFAWSLTSSEQPTGVAESSGKSTKSSQLQRIARQSDGREFDYFRDKLLRPFLIKRVSDTEGIRQVQQHVRSQMTQLGWHVYNDTFVDNTPYGPKTFTNIIAVQNPHSVHRLTLACHTDSKYFEQFEFIGATDSAVPCALMIDTARHLNHAFSSSKLKETSLQLIFFDGEEAFVDWTDTDSLYGARHLADVMEKTFVRNGDVSVSQIQMMDLLVLLDLIGTSSMRFRNWFPQTEKFYLQLQNIEMRLSKEGLLEPRDTFQSKRSRTYFPGSRGVYSPGGVSDDHLPFLRRSMPYFVAV